MSESTINVLPAFIRHILSEISDVANPILSRALIRFAVVGFLGLLSVTVGQAEDLLKLDNGTVHVGIDRDKGGAITWQFANVPEEYHQSGRSGPTDPAVLLRGSTT